MVAVHSSAGGVLLVGLVPLGCRSRGRGVGGGIFRRRISGMTLAERSQALGPVDAGDGTAGAIALALALAGMRRGMGSGRPRPRLLIDHLRLFLVLRRGGRGGVGGTPSATATAAGERLHDHATVDAGHEERTTVLAHVPSQPRTQLHVVGVRQYLHLVAISGERGWGRVVVMGSSDVELTVGNHSMILLLLHHGRRTDSSGIARAVLVPWIDWPPRGIGSASSTTVGQRARMPSGLGETAGGRESLRVVEE